MFNISLLKYFSSVKIKDGLPDPSGPLNEAVPSSLNEEANKEVSAQLASVHYSGKKRRATYMIATLEQKAKVEKYVVKNGTTKAICHFPKDMPCLKESTVREWKTIYLREFAANVKQVKKTCQLSDSLLQKRVEPCYQDKTLIIRYGCT